jgi:hypothetical protein
MNTKTRFFQEVLGKLKERRPYFRLKEIQTGAKDAELAFKDSSLKVYLSEAVKQGLIHTAGRGWYSRLSESVKLDPKPVAKLIRAVEKAFPLLDFTVWSTAQINPWMHHLLAQPVAFLHAEADTLQSVGEKLRELGWEVAVNPAPSTGPKAVRPGEKMALRLGVRVRDESSCRLGGTARQTAGSHGGAKMRRECGFYQRLSAKASMDGALMAALCNWRRCASS